MKSLILLNISSLYASCSAFMNSWTVQSVVATFSNNCIDAIDERIAPLSSFLWNNGNYNNTSGKAQNE